MTFKETRKEQELLRSLENLNNKAWRRDPQREGFVGLKEEAESLLAGLPESERQRLLRSAWWVKGRDCWTNHKCFDSLVATTFNK